MRIGNQPLFARTAGRAAVAAIFQRDQADAVSDKSAKAGYAKSQRSAIAVEIHNDRFGVARRHIPGRNAHIVRRGQRNLFRFGKSRFGRHDMRGVREIHQ